MPWLEQRMLFRQSPLIFQFSHGVDDEDALVYGVDRYLCAHAPGADGLAAYGRVAGFSLDADADPQQARCHRNDR